MSQLRCKYCGNIFPSNDHLKAHEKRRHPLEPDVFEGLPFPGAIGYWVYREEYTGRKGFGVFQCPSCFRTWVSAHARKAKYKQGCKHCEERVLPYIMWYSKERSEKPQEKSTAPHDATRCEACQAGIFCTTSRESGTPPPAAPRRPPTVPTSISTASHPPPAAPSSAWSATNPWGSGTLHRPPAAPHPPPTVPTSTSTASHPLYQHRPTATTQLCSCIII